MQSPRSEGSETQHVAKGGGCHEGWNVRAETAQLHPIHMHAPAVTPVPKALWAAWLRGKPESDDHDLMIRICDSRIRGFRYQCAYQAIKLQPKDMHVQLWL